MHLPSSTLPVPLHAALVDPRRSGPFSLAQALCTLYHALMDLRSYIPKKVFRTRDLKEFSHYRKVEGGATDHETADCFVPATCTSCKCPGMAEGYVTIVLYPNAEDQLTKVIGLSPCPKGGKREPLLDSLCEKCWLDVMDEGK